MTGFTSRAAYLILVLGGGLAIGYATAPGAWYAGLIKPSFTPPGWLFGPVWTLLYICIAIAGWRIAEWQPKTDGRLPVRLWWVQLALNFSWSPIFFGLHLTSAALAVILLLLVAILVLISVSWSRDRIVAALMVPYAIWVTFAGILNASIVVLN